MAPDRLIRIRDIATTPTTPGLIPASASTIWRWVKGGLFPAPLKLTGGTTVWRASEVQDWIKSKTTTAQKAH